MNDLSLDSLSARSKNFLDHQFHQYSHLKIFLFFDIKERNLEKYLLRVANNLFEQEINNFQKQNSTSQLNPKEDQI